MKRKKCGVDLSGLCELSSIDGSLSQGKKHSTTNTSPTTTRWPSGGAKRLKTRTKRKQSSPKFAARLEGVSPSKRGNRKRRRKRIEPITSSPLCLTPTAPLTAATDLEERVNDGPSSVELRRSRSLEQHFNQLQIVCNIYAFIPYTIMHIYNMCCRHQFLLLVPPSLPPNHQHRSQALLYHNTLSPKNLELPLAQRTIE